LAWNTHAVNGAEAYHQLGQVTADADYSAFTDYDHCGDLEITIDIDPDSAMEPDSEEFDVRLVKESNKIFRVEAQSRDLRILASETYDYIITA
jgi:hypothetical protein